MQPNQYTQNHQFVQQQNQQVQIKALPQYSTFVQSSAQFQQNPNNPFGQNNQHHYPHNQPTSQFFLFNPQLHQVYTSSDTIPRQCRSLDLPTDTKTDEDTKGNTDKSNPSLPKTGIGNATTSTRPNSSHSSTKSKVPNMFPKVFNDLSPEKENQNNNNNRSFPLSVNSSIGDPLSLLFEGPSPGVLKVRKSIVIADDITEKESNSAPMTLFEPTSNNNNNEKKDEK